MKIAVTSTAPTLDAEVDPRFGRAAMFVVVDAETWAFDVVDNKQNVEAAQGAGIQAARTVIETGAGVVITGHTGPNAFRTLSAGGVRLVLGAKGTVKQAVEQFTSGKLKAADSADVEGGWV